MQEEGEGVVKDMIGRVNKGQSFRCYQRAMEDSVSWSRFEKNDE